MEEGTFGTADAFVLGEEAAGGDVGCRCYYREARRRLGHEWAYDRRLGA